MFLNAEGIHPGGLVEPDPTAAWFLMASIAIIGNLLVGYDHSQIQDAAKPAHGGAVCPCQFRSS